MPSLDPEQCPMVDDRKTSAKPKQNLVRKTSVKPKQDPDASIGECSNSVRKTSAKPKQDSDASIRECSSTARKTSVKLKQVPDANFGGCSENENENEERLLVGVDELSSDGVAPGNDYNDLVELEIDEGNSLPELTSESNSDSQSIDDFEYDASNSEISGEI